jgi:hypothetical protein
MLPVPDCVSVAPPPLFKQVYGGDLLAAFASWTNDHYGSDFGSSCYYSTACLSDPSRVSEWYDTKSWIWQCCHQLEYWQVWYPNALRSAAIDYAYFEDQCSAAFGDGYPSANVAAFNQEYMGLSPDSTQVHVYWVVGCVSKKKKIKAFFFRGVLGGVSPAREIKTAQFRIMFRSFLFCLLTHHRPSSIINKVIATNGGDDPWRGCTLNATLGDQDNYPETTAFCDG